MKGIILIVHGSRDPKWRLSFERFTASLSLEKATATVRLAYMELNSPTLMQAAQELVESGINNIIVLPFFMSSGGHVDHDIPRLVDEVRLQLPHISIQQVSPIGENPEVIRAMKFVVKDLLKDAQETI